MPFPSWEISRTPVGVRQRQDCDSASTSDNLHGTHGLAHKTSSQSVLIDHSSIHCVSKNEPTLQVICLVLTSRFQMITQVLSYDRLSFVGHNSAADCSISVKFCAGKQFFREFRYWDRYPRSTERIFCFPNGVWASASGGFCIVFYTLVLDIAAQSLNIANFTH